MERRNESKPLHLSDGKVADSDGANLALLEQGAHGLGRFFNRHQRVGPVDLVDVDIVCPQPAEGILDLLENSRPAGIAGYISIPPLKPRLGGNDDARSQ